MSQDNRIKSLNIRELLEQDNYIIPIYQRNYAWGNSEIEALLMDIINAYKRGTKNYYIGSLVVYRRNDGKFEVIDGQQRLTTFTLLKPFLRNKDNLSGSLNSNKRNLSFEYRAESDTALDNLQQLEQLPWNFRDAMQSIGRHWHALISPEKSDEIIKFILDQVQIIRTEVPPETDLNHYFEIMNTRGEQLEKHEILKARFMSRLQELSKETSENTNMPFLQAAFANIWDACSDMNRYVVMGFEPTIRKQIFADNWQKMPSENFNEIAAYFESNKADDSQSQDSDRQTMADILNPNFAIQSKKDDKETSERFNPVIDFPNFLLHVLRVYQEETKKDLKQAKDIQLDDKTLLDSFDVKKFEFENIKQFSIFLLQCRYLFDNYVIKSDTTKEQENHWTLLKIQPQKEKTSSYQYNNSFGDTDEQKTTVMLLSMFHVSHPARIYKNWLYAVLRWLYHNKTDVSAKKYISFLENLSDCYYFCNYGRSIDFFELITHENPDMQTTPSEEFFNAGTSIPNFIFNRLDYLLWKENKLERKNKGREKNQFDKKCDNFRFTFRSSVEHFYPQTPTNGEYLNEDILDSFGNLCLISSGMNSKFSNNMPAAKVANFGKEQNLSLKLSLMMEQAENWGVEKIQKHGKEMIAILNTKSNTKSA